MITWTIGRGTRNDRPNCFHSLRKSEVLGPDIGSGTYSAGTVNLTGSDHSVNDTPLEYGSTGASPTATLCRRQLFSTYASVFRA